MKLTRSEAIEQHRDMWDRIFRYYNERYSLEKTPQPKRIKLHVLKEMNNGVIPCVGYCHYLCDYVIREKWGNCRHCPLEWDVPCVRAYSLYNKFYAAKTYREAAYYALQIRNLKERKM